MLTIAKIKLKNGTEYITPIENLDNVKRMLSDQMVDIEFPEYQDEEEILEDTEGYIVDEGETPVLRKKPGRKPKNQ